MRLKSIKLAGFKSFVDPTTVDFPSNLCAVVGPNGCGKSNIIDAVRWVMGESSAKNLRGESMTDVIFNGSSGRKPVGQASIELVFDNSDGTLIGEYAAYSEIAIKRRVNRDSENHYFLNGQKCRRRDITDIFLGTGLGPRSYAIIEQGMISKLIEAKPAELRVFVEEAAGISKYKERRKETESRMRRTMENLERLSDIREELERQLQHLHRQAQAAEKYTEFKKQERLLKAQLQALQWQALDNQAQHFDQQIQHFELEVEAAVTKQTALDSQLETLFVDNNESREAFEQIQSRYYTLGAEIARCEQSMAHQKERHKKLHDELALNRENRSQAEELLTEDEQQQALLQEELLELSPELELLAETRENSLMLLAETEEQMQAWQQSWDNFNSQASSSQQQVQVQQSRIQQIEISLQRINERKQRFAQELQGLSSEDWQDDIDTLTAQLTELDIQLEEAQQQLEDKQEYIEQKRQATVIQQGNLDTIKTQLQAKRGRLSSLEALQQAASINTNDYVAAWLMRHGLADSELLADDLIVAEGWEKALETVLAGGLQAICVDDITNFAEQVADLEGGSLYLLDKKSMDYQGYFQGKTLISQVNDQRLHALLAGVYIATSLEEALSQRAQLAANESIVTQQGLWLGVNWLRSLKNDDAQAGMIKRRQDIEQLQKDIAYLQDERKQTEQVLAENNKALAQAERQRDEGQKHYKQTLQKQSEQQALLNNRNNKLEQIAHRQAELENEISEANEQQVLEQESLLQARLLLQDAMEAMDEDTLEKEKLMDQRDNLRSALERARVRASQDKDREHQLKMREQALQTQLQALSQSLLRTRAQVTHFIERQKQLELELAERSDPNEDVALELEALLDKRLVLEEDLSRARQAVEQIEQQRRESERQRSVLEQETQRCRRQLEEVRLASQTVLVQRESIQNQLYDSDFDLPSVLADMPGNAEEKIWQQEIEQIANRVSRLGAINLAAIEEYQAALERKNYLDEQDADLQEALNTLENAIRKIDRETRARFKETFDKINEGVQSLFPKVFGGGRAYLEMTGEDLLDTGITIMAQPPGKRNSTIHLLSGGEKALTAIALVFSIFRLNPAPFCMLDEVDAPLDDANVARYARMVKEMSEHVQFIYITHNKIAMEMAQQLLGVTMHEPGVSRIVTVDVEEAAELAAS